MPMLNRASICRANILMLAIALLLSSSWSSEAVAADGLDNYRTDVKLTAMGKGTYRAEVAIIRVDAQGKAETLSTPTVVCAAGQPAVIEVGIMNAKQKLTDGIQVELTVPKDTSKATRVVLMVVSEGKVIHREESGITTPKD